MIIGAVVLLAACESSRPEMTFHRLDPNFGGLQGGKTVQLQAEQLRMDIGYAVYFGLLRSPQVSIEGEKGLLAVTPRKRNPGRVDVTIRADNGSVFVIKNGFEYIDQKGKLLEGPDASEAP